MSRMFPALIFLKQKNQMVKREMIASNDLPEGLGGASGVSELRITDGKNVMLCAGTTAGGRVISFTAGVSALCEIV